MLFFSISIFVIMLIIYCGLAFGYEPYLQGEISKTQDQINQLGQSLSSADEANLLTYYSEIANIQSLITGHVFFSQFLNWLGTHTEANVYYRSFAFNSGSQVTFVAFGKTQADITQQISIFETAPEVSTVSVSSVTFAPTSGNWELNVTLTMNPSVFLWQASSTATAGIISTTPSLTTTTATTTATTTTKL